MTRSCERLTMVLVLAVVPIGAAASQEPSSEAEAWDALKPLVGRWDGSIDGALGTGTAVREYEMIVGDRFLLSRHSSVRLPQAKSPAGDNHEEVGIFSFDGDRAKVVYRQFVIEGFVNQYTCDVETAPTRFVCLTESVENGQGLRARWTVTMVNRHAFDEVFELADPGGEFEVLFTNHWTRRPHLR